MEREPREPEARTRQRTTSLLLEPTVRQTAELHRLLRLLCELYNAAFEERRGAWRWERGSVWRRDQYGELTGFSHPVLDYGVTAARNPPSPRAGLLRLLPPGVSGPEARIPPLRGHLRHRSQRRRGRGYVHVDNRQGPTFSCLSCGHRDHADINAAILRAGLALHPA